MDESASRKRLSVMTPPDNLTKLEKQLSELLIKREDAIVKGEYADASEWNQQIEKKEKQYERAKKR